MQDRLKELQARKSTGGYAQFDDDDVQDSSQFMPAFFDDVDRVKDGLNEIQNKLDELQERQLACVAAVSNDETTQISNQIEKLTDQVTKKSIELKNRLKRMKEDLASIDEKHTTEKRLRENMHGTLTRKFMDLMRQFQESQARYKAKFKERVERQVKIVAPEATQDEIEKIVDSGGSDVFAQNILQKKANDAEEALDYVKQRNEEIKNLEKSIMELHGLFVDMQLLVESQGELLDQIEHSVEASENYVSEAKVELDDAVEYQNSARKKILILIILCICCLAIIIIPLIIKFKN
eukprot:TRINITY_DN3310_c0_g1_i1.p1 TRINITY_DN3310_c0_g1~~TRINITY_DN3310_c0_g1_i1.p1  ORF type:complete len:293 (-),score=62.69 TRINITY_DN3310_c0_g1_i1:109-987(-)